MKKLIIQLIKFGIVGVIATIIDFGVLMFLKEIIHIDVLVASAVAFCVSVMANYVLSMLFVFKSNQSSKGCRIDNSQPAIHHPHVGRIPFRSNPQGRSVYSNPHGIRYSASEHSACNSALRYICAAVAPLVAILHKNR